MRFMLDTNICIYLIKKTAPYLLAQFTARPAAEFCLSSITLAELRYGVAHSEYRDKNLTALTEFLAPLTTVAFDPPAATCYGEIREYLQQRGKLIGAMDLLIAAHAKSLDLTLITNNISEFARVPGLRVENWVEAMSETGNEKELER